MYPFLKPIQLEEIFTPVKVIIKKCYIVARDEQKNPISKQNENPKHYHVCSISGKRKTTHRNKKTQKDTKQRKKKVKLQVSSIGFSRMFRNKCREQKKNAAKHENLSK